MLGRVENEDGIVLVGTNTEPPYAGVLMESQALDGEPVFFALLKGKFRLDEQNLATNEDELQEPDPDELEGQFVADANGNVYAAAKGEDKRESIRQLFYKVAGEEDSSASSDRTDSDAGVVSDSEASVGTE